MMFKKSIIRSQAGVATLLSTVILSSIVLVGGIFMLDSKKNILLSSIKNNLKNEAAFITKEGLALSSFFIANNLVVCRKLGWSKPEKKCRWGGDLLKKEILMSQFKFKKLDHSKNSLVIAKNVKAEGLMFRLKLSFDLINIENSDFILGNLKKTYDTKNTLVGGTDTDGNMVLIRSEVASLAGGNPFVLNRSQALIRRPLAHISMTVAKADVQCNMSCDGGKSNSPYAECRSKAYVPNKGDDKATIASVSLIFKNKGPGLIYSVLAKRTVKRKAAFFGRASNSEKIFQALPAGDKYKLAGANWTIPEAHDCINPTTIVNRVRGRRNTRSVSVHGSVISSIEYSLLLKGKPTVAQTKPLSNLAWSLFFPQAMAADSNSLLQSMDPPRMQSSTLSSSAAIHNTRTVTITYIPPH